MMMPRFQAPRMLSYPPLHNLECVLIVVVIYGGEMFSGCLAGQLGGGGRGGALLWVSHIRICHLFSVTYLMEKVHSVSRYMH